MKIITNTTRRYEQCTFGQVCKYKSKFYLRVSSITTENYYTFNAIDLINDHFTNIPEDAEVTVVNAELVLF